MMACRAGAHATRVAFAGPRHGSLRRPWAAAMQPAGTAAPASCCPCIGGQQSGSRALLQAAHVCLRRRARACHAGHRAAARAQGTKVEGTKRAYLRRGLATPASGLQRARRALGWRGTIKSLFEGCAHSVTAPPRARRAPRRRAPSRTWSRACHACHWAAARALGTEVEAPSGACLRAARARSPRRRVCAGHQGGGHHQEPVRGLHALVHQVHQRGV